MIRITDEQLEETEVRNGDGSPMVLYHGTKASFESFSDEHLQSLGYHFGDLVQAHHFAGNEEGSRLFPVYLHIVNLLDVRPSDFGWLYPKQTAISLLISQVFSYQETAEIIESDNFSVMCHRGLEGLVVRRARNRQIVKLLLEKGFQGICYSNKQEPPDNIARDAYLVLQPKQIFSAITRECLG